MRTPLSVSLCALALALGIVTALLAARNRARAHSLDRLQQWCETFSRRNELWRATIAEEEWRLLREASPALDPLRHPRS